MTTARIRLFTNEFEIGDEVAIIREEHGWHDGRVCGKIIRMTPMSATVQVEKSDPYFGGVKMEINHPRDIYRTQTKPKWMQWRTKKDKKRGL